MFKLFGKRRQRQQESQTHLGKGVKNVEKLLKLSVEKKRSGDLVKAERLCRQAIELAPSNDAWIVARLRTNRTGTEVS